MPTNPSKPPSNSDALIALIREHEGNPLRLASALYSASIGLTEQHLGGGRFSNMAPSGDVVLTGTSSDATDSVVLLPEQPPEHFVGYESILRHLRTRGYLTDTDPNFVGTAKRAADALDEMVLPLQFIRDEVKSELSTLFPSKARGMVVQDPIFVASMCPHHLMPVMMHVVVGYVPSSKEENRVVGLSKLTRALRLLGRQPIMQEDYTDQVVDAIDTYAKADGTAVYARGYHTCMALRGANAPSTMTTTTDVSGVFLHNPQTRAEFYAVANGKIGSFL